MPKVHPFTGLLYDPGAGPLEAVTAPPYDVITPLDRDRLHAASPFNVVRLILGHDEPGDDEDSNRYTRAAARLAEWRELGVLVPVPQPSVFPYELQFHYGGAHHRVRGLVAEVELEPWGGSIVPHERTMIGPIEDRLKLLRNVWANLSPVYGVFMGGSQDLSSFLDEVMTPPPAREIVDESGTHHRLWIAPRPPPLLAATFEQHELLIADGHHRYTVALALREEMRARAGPGPWDAMMMLLVDAATEAPPVLPIHRLVTGAPAVPPVGERVRDMAEVLATLDDQSLTYGTVAKEDGELAHRVAQLSGSPPTVCALHDRLLDRVEGAHLRFVPDSVAAEQAVMTGQADVAFLLPPTLVERVWDVVRTSRRLPQKSTYFWPKPRTGMVIRPFNP